MSLRPRSLADKLLVAVVAATCVILAVSLALALTSDDRAAPASGITGQVMTSQCRPVDQVGDPPCPPYNGPIRILRMDETLVATVHTDPAGRFRIDVHPGRYIVDPNDEGLSVAKGYGRVTVREGAFSHVEVSHSVGIICLLGRTWMHIGLTNDVAVRRGPSPGHAMTSTSAHPLPLRPSPSGSGWRP